MAGQRDDEPTTDDASERSRRSWSQDVAAAGPRQWGGLAAGRALTGGLALLLALAVLGTVELVGIDWAFVPLAIGLVAWGSVLLHPGVAAREEEAHRSAVGFRLLRPQVLWVRGTQPKELVRIQGGLCALAGVVVLVLGALNVAGVVDLAL